MLLKEVPISAIVVDFNTKYMDAPVYWRVVRQGDRTTLLSRDIIDYLPFDYMPGGRWINNIMYEGHNEFNLCDLKLFLNSTGLNWHSAKYPSDITPVHDFVNEPGFLTNFSIGFKNAMLDGVRLPMLSEFGLSLQGYSLFNNGNPKYLMSNTDLTAIVRDSRMTPQAIAKRNTNIYYNLHSMTGIYVTRSNISYAEIQSISYNHLVHQMTTNPQKGIASAGVMPSIDVDENIEVVLNNGIYEMVFNSKPIVSLTYPTNNTTLYEGDALTIAGNADDTNKGDVVTVRYQVNALTPVAILPFVADGAAKSFSRELTFRSGKLYDGTTLIAENLSDGVPHTLKVFAVDDKGGQSPIVERTFYVVPNRTPLLTVEPPVINGVIDSDEMEFTGEFSDPDHNQVTVSYRINGGNSVQVAQGTSGHFDFKVRFGQLQVGLNSIVIEVVDSYGAKVSRTIKLQKDEVAVAKLKSTARYKIKPPLGTATGVVLWVQRDEGLSLEAKISMTQVGEAEAFVAMTKSNTAPMANQPGVVEDQFQFENATAAESIILQLDLEKSALGANERIHAITGVVD